MKKNDFSPVEKEVAFFEKFIQKIDDKEENAPSKNVEIGNDPEWNECIHGLSEAYEQRKETAMNSLSNIKSIFKERKKIILRKIKGRINTTESTTAETSETTTETWY